MLESVQPPNGPRLSCGNVKSVPCRLLRGRDGRSYQFLLSFARRKAGSFSASLSRWLGSKRMEVNLYTLSD